MIKLFDIQQDIHDAIANDATFETETISKLGSAFDFKIDLGEIYAVEDIPTFIIHKSFSFNTTQDVDSYAIQFNLICDLGEPSGNYYPSIKSIEELAHMAIEISDRAICKYGLHRATVKQFSTEIDQASTIEWVVLIGYMAQADEFI